MPGKIKVKVLAGRNLPVMDRASDTTDAFVEIKFGSVTHKTDVCRKSLNPHWNSTEWYRFEVDESELQDEPLQLRLMDHDTYSANDAIGKVVISLAPLLAREANNAKSTTAPQGGAVMSGWIPVFDTMHGIRGELNVIVKVELFSDFNKYKTSSCGVQFFHCPMIPPGYRATAIHGFVEELVVNDDPEYQWIDKIRTPRASNEARQVAFIKLSNQVQRLIGLKAAELGANAVVGYQQDFDLEGEAGVVARAIGTAVSIVPLPTPSQPINMPPCTQQQLKKYLDILVNDNESIGDVNQYYQTHQEELQKLITILNPNASSLLDETDAVEEDERSLDSTRHSSITSYTGCISLYQDDYVSHKSLRHLSEDQTDLNRLLNRDADDSDSSGPFQKIKRLKAHFFSKRFPSRRKSEKQEDQVSIKSFSSDTSRMSLYDIKNELKKIKRLKKPKFRKAFVNKEDEGEGMASILARSVIHANTSLACIAESQDSEHSPSSTMRRTSESEPTINVSDDDRVQKQTDNTNESVKVPEIRYTSLSNINVDETHQPRQRKISESCPTTPVAARSENLLKLPGEVGYYGSVSSELSRESSEIYSSSDEDDESSDVRTDTEKSIETTSSVVQSVMNQNIDQNFVALMDTKLSILETVTPDANEIRQQDSDESLDFESEVQVTDNKTIAHKSTELKPLIIDNKVPIEKCKSLDSVPQGVKEKEIDYKPIKSNEASTSSVKGDMSVSKSNSHIKFNNPFAHKKASKSISAPSSPVEKSSFVRRSSKRIKRQLSKLSKSNMIKSLSHYSLMPKKKERQKPLSQPGSSSDIRYKAPSETVLGSTFLSYSDLLSLDREGSEGKKLFHKSDEFDRAKVSMYIGSEPVSRASLSGPSSTYHLKIDHDEHRKPSFKSSGLVHTAMETILLDKVNSLLIPTSPDYNSAQTKQFFSDVSDKLEKVEENRNNTSQIQLNNADQNNYRSLCPPKLSLAATNHALVHNVRRERDSKSKSPGLVQTAMETILMDKVHSLLTPTTPDSPKSEIILGDVLDAHENNGQNKNKNKKPGLIQSIILGVKTSVPTTPIEKLSFSFSKSDKKNENKPTGLVQTAMETMLMEKVQSVLGPKTPDPVATTFFDIDKKPPKENEDVKKVEEKLTTLTQTALETILMDKIQTSLLAKTPEPITILGSDDVLKQVNLNDTKAKDTVTGLTCNEMETISIDKIQVLSNPSNISLTTLTNKNDKTENFCDNLEQLENIEKAESLKPTGLIQTTVQTILLDKVQSLVPAETVITVHGYLCEKTTMNPEETADQTILLDKIRPLIPAEPDDIATEEPKKGKSDGKSEIDQRPSSLVQTNVETKLSKEDPENHTIHLNKVTEQSLDSNLNTTTVPENRLNEQTDEESQAELNSPGLVQTALQTILLDTVHSLIPPQTATSVPDKQVNESGLLPSSLEHTTVQEIVLDKEESLIPAEPNVVISKEDNDDLKPPGLTQTGIKTSSVDTDVSSTKINVKQEQDNAKNIDTETSLCDIAQSSLDNDETRRKNKKLIRQASIYSLNENESKMSNTAQCIVTKPPMLQHFHPVVSGTPLETIPSLPESSFDQPESIESDTNNASVCCNVHAACDTDRGEIKESKENKDKGSPRHARHESYGGREPAQTAHVQNSSLNASSTPMGIHRRSSDSDLSVTPKGGSLNTSAGNVGSGGGAILRPSMNSNNLDMLEYPFLTMTEYPPGFIVHLGGTVCARSVKLVDAGGESAARAAWWAELRTELRAHARALRCNAVIAYADTAAICEDVCVLSASGTAAVINLDCDFNADPDITVNAGSKNAIDELEPEWCALAHVPYSPGAGPYRAELASCGGCRRARVPTVLLATCAKPNRLVSNTKAITLTAVAARVRRAQPTSEPGARDISDQLPFLEYELHKLLLAKLRMQGANALFSLQTQIAVGERCVMALASGTAVRLAGLPPPTPPRIKATEKDKDALEIQKALWDSFTANRTANGFDIGYTEHSTNGVLPETEGEEAPALDLCADKDACVLELDEAEDVETARSLAARHVNMQVYTPALKPTIGAPPHAFAQVWRGRLSLSGQGAAASVTGERHVRRALDGVSYKLRRLQPCALVAPRFQLELPEDEIQLVVSGAAVPLQDPSKPQTNGTSDPQQNLATGDADDDIFTLDEDHLVRSHNTEPDEKTTGNGQAPTAVSLTSLSHISGGRLVRRLCALRLLFVRETTAVRELGGLSGFLHTFTCEVLAIVRAYTAALGGNALTSFYITQLMLQDNAHKNQGQCLLSVGGDVVHITY